MNSGSAPALPAPSGGATSINLQAGKTLSRRAKAAIIVRYLINNGAEIPLEELPEELQEVLTHQMGAMRLVDRDTLDDVIGEFSSELERVGLHFAGGIAGALDALDGKISPHTAKRLRREAGVRQMGNPWDRIRGLPAEKLKPVFEEERAEVCAVILSNLSVAVAAELLGLLPGPRAREITYAISQTNAVTAEAVDRIGLSLATQLEAEPEAVFDNGPVQRVGAILNNSTSATRDDVLTGLDETDKQFADQVRKAIFTFANIPTRLAPRDLPTVVRAIDQSQLVIALAAAEQEGLEDVTAFVFDNISSRMGDQIREEMSELEKVKPADGEAAMSAIVAMIREMETRGEVTLLQVEDDDED
jgi:flagellar motor switch protein FliG